MGCGCKSGVSKSKSVVKKTAVATPRRSRASSGRIIKRMIK